MRVCVCACVCVCVCVCARVCVCMHAQLRHVQVENTAAGAAAANDVCELGGWAGAAAAQAADSQRGRHLSPHLSPLVTRCTVDTRRTLWAQRALPACLQAAAEAADAQGEIADLRAGAEGAVEATGELAAKNEELGRNYAVRLRSPLSISLPLPPPPISLSCQLPQPLCVRVWG